MPHQNILFPRAGRRPRPSGSRPFSPEYDSDERLGEEIRS